MRPRVLLVEDAPTEAEPAQAHLDAFGHECHHAGTVAAALDIAAAQPPDAVLIDLQLPDGSGFELMRRLRQAGVDAAFIVITVNGTAAAAMEPLAAVEKRAILAALAHTVQDVPRAAALLEVNPSTIYRKLATWKKDA